MSDDLWNRYIGTDYTPEDFLSEGSSNINTRLTVILTELWNGWNTEPGDRLSQDKIEKIATKLTRFLEKR